MSSNPNKPSQEKPTASHAGVPTVRHRVRPRIEPSGGHVEDPSTEAVPLKNDDAKTNDLAAGQYDIGRVEAVQPIQAAESALPEIEDDANGGGYGRPPRKHQFQRGEGGNPKGRKKKAQQQAAERSGIDIIEAELAQLIKIRQGGKDVSIPTTQALFKALVRKAMTGSVPAIKIALEQHEKVELSKANRARLAQLAADSAKEHYDREVLRIFEDFQKDLVDTFAKLDSGELNMDDLDDFAATECSGRVGCTCPRHRH